MRTCHSTFKKTHGRPEPNPQHPQTVGEKEMPSVGAVSQVGHRNRCGRTGVQRGRKPRQCAKSEYTRHGPGNGRERIGSLYGVLSNCFHIMFHENGSSQQFAREKGGSGKGSHGSSDQAVAKPSAGNQALLTFCSDDSCVQPGCEIQ